MSQVETRQLIGSGLKQRTEEALADDFCGRRLRSQLIS